MNFQSAETKSATQYPRFRTVVAFFQTARSIASETSSPGLGGSMNFSEDGPLVDEISRSGVARDQVTSVWHKGDSWLKGRRLLTVMPPL
jgi:hypothetical protein